jgi:hypothetical protein
VASREEQKRRLREEREARERQERAAHERRTRLIRYGVGAAVVIVAAVIAVVALSGGGSSKGSKNGNGPSGLQNTPGPWSAGSENVGQRSAKLGLPDPSDTVFHIHAHLDIYTDGKKQTIPGNIGIDQGGQFLASLHTHATDGVVHMEAVQPYKFTLRQFFTIWNVPFTTTQIGSYHVGNGLVLQTWVNGKEIKDAPNHVMKRHDKIVIGFGKPGSFPTKSNFKFPAGE